LYNLKVILPESVDICERTHNVSHMCVSFVAAELIALLCVCVRARAHAHV